MFPLPLVVTIGDSQRLRWSLAATHLCGAGAIFLAALPTDVQLTGLALLLFSLVYYWRPAPDVRLRGKPDGTLEIWRQEQWHVARLAATSVILPGCTVLRLGIGTGPWRRNLVVLPDSLPPDDFRRLRVWLRWRASRPDATAKPDQ
jgi:toxin CptA